jgi:hypothetical protein
MTRRLDRPAGNFYRVDWRPGTDQLRGRCHCGVTVEADDPAVLWDLLLAHPNHAP